MELTEKQHKQVEDYKEQIMSGRTLLLHEASARSIIGYQPPTPTRNYAAALAIIAKLAAKGDSYANVASHIVHKLPVWSTPGHAVGNLYAAAYEAMKDDFKDVIGLAGPEPGRYSDRTRPYTLIERVTVMIYLQAAKAALLPGELPSVGWTLSAICDELHIRKEVN